MQEDDGPDEVEVEFLRGDEDEWRVRLRCNDGTIESEIDDCDRRRRSRPRLQSNRRRPRRDAVMDEFTPYGTSHRLIALLLVVGVVALVALGRTRRDTVAADRDARAFALLTLAFVLPLQVVALTRSGFDVDRTLPLQLCDLAAFVAPFALWTRRAWAVGLTYYWGLTLTTQAVITPDLSADFPDPVFVLFWGMHLLIVWAAVYLTWGLGLAPDWRGYRATVAVTVGWAMSVSVFNLATGSNYGYLNRKPAAASILDYLGDWPVYVLAEIVIVLTVWALMTWPWVRSRTGN